MASIIVLGILFSALGIVWDGFSTLVFRAGFLGEAVPPIPAFVSLLLLLPLRPVLRRILGRAGFRDSELLATYGFLTIAVTVCFVNGLRGIVDLAAIPYYGDPNDAILNYVRPYWPHWFAPSNPQVIRWLYQGSPSGQVPWAHWLVPIACIGGLLVLIMTATTSLYALLARRWMREERLAYPIAELAASMVRWEPTGQPGAVASLFRTRLFWWGAAGAVIFNAFWLVPAVFSPGHIPPIYTDLNALLPAGPLRAGYTMFVRYNPVVLGLGLLVPSEVLFSTWFSTLLLKLESVVLAWLGQSWDTTFHLAGRQGFGGYLVQAGFLLWLARPMLAGAVRALLGEQSGAEAREEGRFLFFLVAAALGLVWAMAANQMPVWLAVCLVAMLLILALVNARIRTQVGVPIIYLHGGGALEGSRGLLFLLGGKAIASAGAPGVTALSVFSFLSLSTMLAPYQAEGYRLAQSDRVGRSRWAFLSVLAVAVGVVFGFVVHLSVYYHFGGEYLKWTPSAWPITVIVKDAMPANPSPPQWAPVLAGALSTVVCILGHRASLAWPIHPIGFITAGAIGGYIIGQFFLAWLAKGLALRYGGLGAFLKLKEFFLGLVVVHFCIATAWCLAGMLGFTPATNYIFLFF